MVYFICLDLLLIAICRDSFVALSCWIAQQDPLSAVCLQAETAAAQNTQQEHSGNAAGRPVPKRAMKSPAEQPTTGSKRLKPLIPQTPDVRPRIRLAV